MDKVIEIDSQLEIKPEAINAINNLILESNHPDPLLAILYIGSGTNDEDVCWEWNITTISSGALLIITYLKFKIQEFIFYSTYEDLELLKEKLNNMVIDCVDNKLVINFRNA